MTPQRCEEPVRLANATQRQHARTAQFGDGFVLFTTSTGPWPMQRKTKQVVVKSTCFLRGVHIVERQALWARPKYLTRCHCYIFLFLGYSSVLHTAGILLSKKREMKIKRAEHERVYFLGAPNTRRRSRMHGLRIFHSIKLERYVKLGRYAEYAGRTVGGAARHWSISKQKKNIEHESASVQGSCTIAHRGAWSRTHATCPTRLFVRIFIKVFLQ